MPARRADRFGATAALAVTRAPAPARGPTASSVAWTRAARTVGDESFGTGPGCGTAAELLSHSLADSTKAGYVKKWLMILSFCQASCYDYFRATTETVACYVGFTFERGTVAPGTIQKHTSCRSTPCIRF